MYYESMIDMIDIGKELCHELRFGVEPSLVLGKLQRTGSRRRSRRSCCCRR